MAEPSSSDKSLPALAAGLWDLVRAYAKQELVEPVKGIGRFAAFGLAGSLVLGVGTVLVALGVLRVLQSETGSTFEGNWSWAPYLVTLLGCLAVVGLALSATRRRSPRR